MAGCFGNNPIDRFLEDNCLRYQDGQLLRDDDDEPWYTIDHDAEYEWYLECREDMRKYE